MSTEFARRQVGTSSASAADRRVTRAGTATRRRADEGFTLAEVIVSIALFTIISFSVMFALVTAGQVHRRHPEPGCRDQPRPAGDRAAARAEQHAVAAGSGRHHGHPQGHHLHRHADPEPGRQRHLRRGRRSQRDRQGHVADSGSRSGPLRHGAVMLSRAIPACRSRRARFADDRGITLAELMVSMTLTTILGTMAVLFFVGATHAGYRTVLTNQNTSDARLTLDSWTNMLRVAGWLDPNTKPTGSRRSPRPRSSSTPT